MNDLAEPQSKAGLAADRALAERLFDEIAALSTTDAPGVSRPAYSQIETQALACLERIATGEGLVARRDRAGNLCLALPQQADAPRHTVIGSHIDTVPQGGNFDGLAGIVAGVVLLARAHREGRLPPQPLQVLAMRGEESAWFGPCYIGSKLLTGTLGTGELAMPHRGDGRPLSAHLADLGLPMDEIAAGTPLTDLSRMQAYFELHIEQGPLLIDEGRAAAVVSGIRGNIRYGRMRCLGEAGHSGAVPRHLRHDPLLAVAELMIAVDAEVRSFESCGIDVVATTGILHTETEANAVSRIPGEIRFSLDMRSDDQTVLERFEKAVLSEMARIGEERGVRFDPGPRSSVAPAQCAPDLVDRLTRAMRRAVPAGAKLMPSGGGHDAATFANAGVPTAMLFVRNRNGSHNPDEAMEIADLLAGVDVLDQALLRQG